MVCPQSRCLGQVTATIFSLALVRLLLVCPTPPRSLSFGLASVTHTTQFPDYVPVVLPPRNINLLNFSILTAPTIITIPNVINSTVNSIDGALNGWVTNNRLSYADTNFIASANQLGSSFAMMNFAFKAGGGTSGSESDNPFLTGPAAVKSSVSYTRTTVVRPPAGTTVTIVGRRGNVNLETQRAVGSRVNSTFPYGVIDTAAWIARFQNR